MKRKTLLTLSFFFLLIPAFAAPSFKEWWEKGNAFYAQKEYDSAAVYFNKIAAEKPADPAVYYNLGNTYYRLNQVSMSILNYERALKRNPDYKEASDNLVLAQSRIPGRMLPASDIFFMKWYKAASSPKYAMTWAVVSLLFFILLLGALLYRRVGRNAGWVRPQLIGFIVVFWIIALLFSFQAAKSLQETGKAVVMENDTPFYLQPSAVGKPLSIIPEGTTVNVIEQSGKWMEITLPDGRDGWIVKASALLVD